MEKQIAKIVEKLASTNAQIAYFSTKLGFRETSKESKTLLKKINELKINAEIFSYAANTFGSDSEKDIIEINKIREELVDKISQLDERKKDDSLSEVAIEIMNNSIVEMKIKIVALLDVQNALTF